MFVGGELAHTGIHSSLSEMLREHMTQSIGRFLALLSACGFSVSVLAYIYSFLGKPVDKVLWGWLVLLPGWMALFLPMYVLEYPQSRTPSFCLKGFARGMPSWVAPSSWLFSLIAVTHLIWLAVENGLGVPAIVNGQYVLGSRGRILRALTQAEYLALTEAELRALSTILISFYFVTTMYWWFRQSRPKPDRTS